jgi:hypothetical protein
MRALETVSGGVLGILEPERGPAPLYARDRVALFPHGARQKPEMTAVIEARILP